MIWKGDMKHLLSSIGGKGRLRGGWQCELSGGFSNVSADHFSAAGSCEHGHLLPDMFALLGFF